jgi:flagellar biosynthesis protein FliQ
MLLASCLAYPSILKMETVSSSETLVNLSHATLYYIPKTVLFIATSVGTSDVMNSYLCPFFNKMKFILCSRAWRLYLLTCYDVWYFQTYTFIHIS